MSYIIPPGFALLAMRHSITGDPEEMLCLIGVDCSAFTPFTATQADFSFNAWKNALDTSVTNEVTFLGCTAYVGQDGTDPVVIDSTAATVTGAATGSCLPPNCSYLVGKQSASGGRANRGRFFLPGVPEGNVSPAGVLTSPMHTQIQTDCTTFFNAMDTGDLPLVILHTTGSALDPTPVTSLVASTKIATQRRRLR